MTVYEELCNCNKKCTSKIKNTILDSQKSYITSYLIRNAHFEIRLKKKQCFPLLLWGLERHHLFNWEDVVHKSFCCSLKKYKVRLNTFLLCGCFHGSGVWAWVSCTSSSSKAAKKMLPKISMSLRLSESFFYSHLFHGRWLLHSWSGGRVWLERKRKPHEQDGIFNNVI